MRKRFWIWLPVFGFLLVGITYIIGGQVEEIKASSNRIIQATSRAIKEEKLIRDEMLTQDSHLAQNSEEEIIKLDVSGDILEGLQDTLIEIKENGGEVTILESDENKLLMDYTIKNEEGKWERCSFSMERSAMWLPAYETKDEAIKYFKARHKDMTLLEVYSHDEDYLKQHSQQSQEVLYKIQEGDRFYLYCNYEGYSLSISQYLELEEFTGGFFFSIRYDEFRQVLSWNGDGTFTERDFQDNWCRMTLDIGTGTPFIFEFELDSIELQEIGNVCTYSVKVSEEGNNNPFQLLEVQAVDSLKRNLFNFEDINMDGYQDLIVDYYRAHNVSRTAFLWNSVQREFVSFSGSGELNYGAGYRLIPEKRQVLTRIHGTASDTDFTLYQFISETDYQKLREFSRYVVYDEGPESVTHFTITYYDKQGNVSDKLEYSYGEDLTDEKENELFDAFLNNDRPKK